MPVADELYLLYQQSKDLFTNTIDKWEVSHLLKTFSAGIEHLCKIPHRGRGMVWALAKALIE